MINDKKMNLSRLGTGSGF